MGVNVEVTRSNNENALSLLRKFTKRVQGAGVLPRVRGIRYHSRTLSHYKTKMKTLEGISRREQLAEDIKLGKVVENSKKR